MTTTELLASLEAQDKREAAKLAMVSAWPKQLCVHCAAVCSRNEFGDVVCGQIECPAFAS